MKYLTCITLALATATTAFGQAAFSYNPTTKVARDSLKIGPGVTLTIASGGALVYESGANVPAGGGGGGGGGIWGTITGTLANQTDLAAVLAAKQPINSALTGLAALSYSANQYAYATGADSFALGTISPAARTFLAAADAAAMRSVIGAGTSTFSGAYSALTGIPSTFTPGAHTHASTDISDSTTVGRQLVQAQTAAAGRSAIGAAASDDSRLPTADQKAGLDGHAGSAANPYVTATELAGKADAATTVDGYHITDAVAVPTVNPLSGVNIAPTTWPGTRSTATWATEQTLTATGAGGWPIYGVHVVHATTSTDVPVNFPGSGVYRNGGATLTTSHTYPAGKPTLFFWTLDGTALYLEDGDFTAAELRYTHTPVNYSDTTKTLESFITGADTALGLRLTSANIDNTAYDASSWDNDTTHAPTKNAVRDKFESLSLTHPHNVTFIVNGNGTVITTGTKDAYVKVPYGGTLVGWTMMAKPSATATVDIFRAANSAGLPTASIVGGSGTKPGTSAAVENSSTSFTSWASTTITALDNFTVQVTANDSATYIQVTLYYQ